MGDCGACVERDNQGTVADFNEWKVEESNKKAMKKKPHEKE